MTCDIIRRVPEGYMQWQHQLNVSLGFRGHANPKLKWLSYSMTLIPVHSTFKHLIFLHTNPKMQPNFYISPQSWSPTPFLYRNTTRAHVLTRPIIWYSSAISYQSLPNLAVNWNILHSYQDLIFWYSTCVCWYTSSWLDRHTDLLV